MIIILIKVVTPYLINAYHLHTCPLQTYDTKLHINGKVPIWDL